MSFYRRKEVYITFEQINDVLEIIKKCNFEIVMRKKEDGEMFLNRVFIEDLPIELRITFKPTTKAICYIFKKDAEEVRHYKNGGEAFRILSQYVKIQRYEGERQYDVHGKEVTSAVQLLYKNEKYDGKRVRAYSYDVNSAFNAAMLQPIPDITTLKRDPNYLTPLGKNQIGFNIQKVYSGDYVTWAMTCTFEEGEPCDYVCDLMPSPFGKFVEKWYGNKKNAKNRKDKVSAKDVLVMSVGMFQRHNPFLRACIVERSNQFIRQFIDKDTIYCNTDCIVSTRRRKDIERKYLGNEIGQFKMEHCGDMFAWQKGKVNYQWNYDIPSARGVSKGWFKKFNDDHGRPFDILTDKTPSVDSNYYWFNPDTLKVEENNGK